MGADVPAEPPPDAEQPLIDLQETYRGLTAKNLLESYHYTQQALDQALNLFSLGYLSLDQRCIAENLYWAISRRIEKLAGDLDYDGRFRRRQRRLGHPSLRGFAERSLTARAKASYSRFSSNARAFASSWSAPLLSAAARRAAERLA